MSATTPAVIGVAAEVPPNEKVKSPLAYPLDPVRSVVAMPAVPPLLGAPSKMAAPGVL